MVWTTKLVRASVFFAILELLSGCAGYLARENAPVGTDSAAAHARSEQRDIGTVPKHVTDSSARQATHAQKPSRPPIAQSPNLWRELSRELSIHGLDLPRVRQEIAAYRQQQKFLRETSARAAPYLYHIVETLRARGLPRDLALLPILESGFNPQVESPHGAAGLWQFMSGTGSRFGLARTEWIDERLDFVRSTDVALSYLATLAARFDDDWLMAVAAYNAGWGNVERAIQRNQRAGRPTDVWSLPLQGETHRLVSRLLALIEIYRDPDRYGLQLPELPARPYFATLTLDKPTDLRRLAELSRIDLPTFAALNPGYRRWHTGPSGAHLIHVPIAQLESTRLIAARIGPTVPGLRVAAVGPAKHGGAGREYRVQPGDSLWIIARRFDTRIARLEAMNGIRRIEGLKPGQRLRVPDTANPGFARVSAAPTKPTDSNAMVRYRVRAGDSLWTIARRFGVSIIQLRNWNGLAKRATLKPGQELLVYRPA